MTPGLLNRLVVQPVLSWLAEPFHGQQAAVLLLAIALQETNLETRDQNDEDSPGLALGFWQLDRIAARDFAQDGTPRCKAAVADLGFELLPGSLWTRIGEGADHLACVLARDRLWRLVPEHLPPLGDLDESWRQYARAWAPRKPCPERWAESYAKAMEGTAA